MPNMIFFPHSGQGIRCRLSAIRKEWNRKKILVRANPNLRNSLLNKRGGSS